MPGYLLKLFNKYWKQIDEEDPVLICRFFTENNQSYMPIRYNSDTWLCYGLIDWIKPYRWEFDHMALGLKLDSNFKPIRYSEYLDWL